MKILLLMLLWILVINFVDGKANPDSTTTEVSSSVVTPTKTQNRGSGLKIGNKNNGGKRNNSQNKNGNRNGNKNGKKPKFGETSTSTENSSITITESSILDVTGTVNPNSVTTMVTSSMASQEIPVDYMGPAVTSEPTATDSHNSSTLMVRQCFFQLFG